MTSDIGQLPCVDGRPHHGFTVWHQDPRGTAVETCHECGNSFHLTREQVQDWINAEGVDLPNLPSWQK